MKQITVRELGGEIWAELTHVSWHDSELQSVSHDDLARVLDITMGVIARHANKRLQNDEDMPVLPLIQREAPSSASPRKDDRSVT